MALDVTPSPDGALVLWTDGSTVIQSGVRRGEPIAITERRYDRHQCGRPSMPSRVARGGYADPTREIRRRAAIRSAAERG
jgi:hypothetical protein